MEQCVRVLTADDQVYVRQGLQALLAAWPELEVVGIGTTSVEVVQVVGQRQPEVILMDIQRPGLSLSRTEALAGLEVIRLIRSQWPQVRIVVLTMYTTHRAAALAAGADAFLIKGCAAETIRAALLPPRPVIALVAPAPIGRPLPVAG
jgi:DNA-binding NarL/FixJ family response regulator